MIGAENRAGCGRRDQLEGCPPRLTHGGHHADSAYHSRPCDPNDRRRRRSRSRPGSRSHERRRARWHRGCGRRLARHDHVRGLTKDACPNGKLPNPRFVPVAWPTKPEQVPQWPAADHKSEAGRDASLQPLLCPAPPETTTLAVSGWARLAPVSAVLKHGTMTLGKPKLGRRLPSLGHRGPLDDFLRHNLADQFPAQ
jgi:hypothetical protein